MGRHALTIGHHDLQPAGRSWRPWRTPWRGSKPWSTRTCGVLDDCSDEFDADFLQRLFPRRRGAQGAGKFRRRPTRRCTACSSGSWQSARAIF